MRRSVVCIVALALVVCSVFASGTGETTAAPTQKVTLGMNIQNTSLDYEKDEVYRWVKEKFNVDFKFYQYSSADWKQKVQIWVASGDMPGIMSWDFKAYDMPQYTQWVKQGAIRAMPSDLSKYPNVKEKILDTMTTDDFLMVDGKRYALPRIRDYYYLPGEELEYVWEAGHIMYRRDWAKKLGLYKENDVYTWDEAMALAKAFMEKDPGGNGAGKTIGYALVDWGLGQGFAGVVQNFPDYVGYREGYVKKNGTYEWSGSQPGMIDGIKAFRKIVDDGTLWRDQPVAKGNAAIDRYYAGEVGLCMQYWNIGRVKTAREKMIAIHGMSIEQSRDATALMHIQMKNGSLFALPVEDYWSVQVFSPKMDDVEMDRFLQVANWSASTEGNFSMKYGPKGKGWDMVGGAPKVLLPVNPETKAFVYPDTVVSGWYMFLPVTSIDYVLNGKADVGRQELKVYEDTDPFSNLYKGRLKGYTPVDNYPKFFSGPSYNKYGNFANDVNTAVLEIVYGGKTSYDGIEQAWKAWVASKMPLVQSVLDELNAGLK